MYYKVVRVHNKKLVSVVITGHYMAKYSTDYWTNVLPEHLERGYGLACFTNLNTAMSFDLNQSASFRNAPSYLQVWECLVVAPFPPGRACNLLRHSISSVYGYYWRKEIWEYDPKSLLYIASSKTPPNHHWPEHTLFAEAIRLTKQVSPLR